MSTAPITALPLPVAIALASIIEASRCLGSAQARQDRAGVSHWQGEVKKYEAEIKAQIDLSSFQAGVGAWMEACFEPEVCADLTERGDRFAEEAVELLQSNGYDRNRLARIIGRVYSRPVGEPQQEVGGVMVTLAAYCGPMGVNLYSAATRELAHIWTRIEAIRGRQAEKRQLHEEPVAPPPRPGL